MSNTRAVEILAYLRARARGERPGLNYLAAKDALDCGLINADGRLTPYGQELARSKR